MKSTKDAIIKIVNKQRDDGCSDVIRETYDGRFYENNGKFFIAYKESENVSCMITVDGGTVFVKRSGESESRIVCENGREYNFMYTMPYGKIEMKSYTDLVVNKIDNNGGTLRIVYKLYVSGGCIENDMTISVEPMMVQ